MNTEPLTNPPAYLVTPFDNFDWYEGAGVPTKCRDAEHALSVAKGILERSLVHEHGQTKDPSSAEELFERWDDFGDYPSIRPEFDPPFDPSEYARRRAAEICSALEPSVRPGNGVRAADFPPGTKFFEIEDIPIAWPPETEPVNALNGKRRTLSHKTSMKLAYEHEIAPEEFDAYVAKSISSAKADEVQDDEGSDPNCYAFYSEDSYPAGLLIDAIRRLTNRPDLPAETSANLKVFLFAMERLPLVTPGVRMNLGLRLDQGGESDWIEIRMEDGEFSLGSGTWIDGDADTETIFEVTSDYRDGDAFIATQFAESFTECARDVCREVVIEDTSDETFVGWYLARDKKRWASLPCSFL
jgi:hypothetical protein